MDSYGERERRRSQAVQHAEFRRRMLGAGGINADGLSEQGRRILAWLAEWDDWTVGGVVEMLGAAYRAGISAATTEREPATRDRRDIAPITTRLNSLDGQRREPELGL